jgi:hypothetical protein
MITPVGSRSKNYRRLSQHSGQAIVLILLLTLAALVAGVALYSTGILTSEKIQLQNAADASAYSVSVVEARDLNFTAYLNRSMVANEVAIGQMVSMMSWAYMTRSTPEFIDDYAFKLDLILCVVSLGTSCQSASSGVRPITQPLRTVTRQVFKAVELFTAPISEALTYLNLLYSYSQKGFHLLSLIFSVSTLFEIKDNNINNAEFSMFGILALSRHFTSYYGDLISSNLYGFVNGYSASEDDAAGMNRLAQVVNDSRDGFTKNRECSLPPLTITEPPPINLGIMKITFAPPRGVKCRGRNNPGTGGWEATFLGLKAKIDTFLFILDFSLHIGVGRDGGTDLRQSDDFNYTWTGADSTAPFVTFGGGFQPCLGVPLIGRVCAPRLGFTLKPPTPPFGVGAAMAGQDAPSTSDIPYGDDPREIMYGTASENFLAWDFVLPPFKITPDTIRHVKSIRQQFTSVDRNINKVYQLRGYQDTEDRPEISTFVDSGDWISGFESPYLLIGLIKTGAVKNSQVSKGRFELDAPENGLLGGTVPLGVIAKSEVYYTRPSDLNYFGRGDLREEKPNAFNPYWQARLVDTSYIDRVAALSFQHGQVPLPQTALMIISQFQFILDQIGP